MEPKITKQVSIEFADGKFETTFTLTRQESLDKSESRYWLEAVTSTGFNLTGASYGTLNYSYEVNRRLRSQKSILNEMNAILDDVVEYASNNLKRFVLKNLTVETTLRDNEWQFFKETGPFQTCSIKSLESGNPVSWYYHDVYNTTSPIVITFSRKNSGQLTAHATEAGLYDMNKLKALYFSDAYQKQHYAFFFYNEVKRLVGEPFEGSSEAMSGLFSKGTK